MRRLVDLEYSSDRHRRPRRQTSARRSKRRQVVARSRSSVGPKSFRACLHASHLLIGKAGGATVQETIAAGCPMIINHVVSGQEEGNARLIVETNSGVVAHFTAEVVAQVRARVCRRRKTMARMGREHPAGLSRPRASLDIAEFLLSI